MRQLLEVTRLQWSPEDVPFREVAFAILYLAIGGEHITFVSGQRLEINEVFAQVRQGNLEKEFVRSLNTGAHSPGDPPSSAPEETVYWLEGVLVFLTHQLYRRDDFRMAMTRAENHCQEHYPEQCIDAILMSIEHLVLLHVVPGEEIQRSPLMPLFDLKCHHVVNVRRDLTEHRIKKLQAQGDESTRDEDARPEDTPMDEEEEGISKRWRLVDLTEVIESETTNADDKANTATGSTLNASGTTDERDAESTFYALVHVFEAAASRRTQRYKTSTRTGRLPNEIYSQVLTTLPINKHWLASWKCCRHSVNRASRTCFS